MDALKEIYYKWSETENRVARFSESSSRSLKKNLASGDFFSKERLRRGGTPKYIRRVVYIFVVNISYGSTLS